MAIQKTEGPDPADNQDRRSFDGTLAIWIVAAAIAGFLGLWLLAGMTVGGAFGTTLAVAVLLFICIGFFIGFGG